MLVWGFLSVLWCVLAFVFFFKTEGLVSYVSKMLLKQVLQIR